MFCFRMNKLSFTKPIREETDNIAYQPKQKTNRIMRVSIKRLKDIDTIKHYKGSPYNGFDSS